MLKKLYLNRETIRTLDAHERSGVEGGISALLCELTKGASWYLSCASKCNLGCKTR